MTTQHASHKPQPQKNRPTQATQNKRKITAIITIMLSTMPALAWAQSQPDAQNCLTVAIGNTQDYSCLNHAFAAMAPNQQRPSSLNAPYNATSSATELGTFNHSAIHEELGSNFGLSAIPQRPPPPVFAIPSLNPR